MDILKWTDTARDNMDPYLKGFFWEAMHQLYPKYKNTDCKLTDVIEGPDFWHVWFWNDKNVPFYITIKIQNPFDIVSKK